MHVISALPNDAASNGRFVLGLGSQVKPHIERRFSTPWSAPAPRTQEYINSVRAIWNTWKTGERLAFEGDHYNFSLMTPNFTPPTTDHREGKGPWAHDTALHVRRC